MKLDINTLTQEQKKQLVLWYNIYINENWKLVIEEPTEKNDLYKEYLKDQAYKKFTDTISIINKKYTEDEQKTFEIKRVEAQKVIDSWSSPFIETLCVEWETPEDLANLILQNSQMYQTLYASAEKQLREDLKAI